MNFEFKGNIGFKLKNKRILEINAKEKNIVLNVRNISGVKRLVDLVSFLTDNEIKTDDVEEKIDYTKTSNNKDKFKKIVAFLKNQGYSVSVKIKGITIIKDLETSKLAKLFNFLI